MLIVLSFVYVIKSKIFRNENKYINSSFDIPLFSLKRLIGEDGMRQMFDDKHSGAQKPDETSRHTEQ